MSVIIDDIRIYDEFLGAPAGGGNDYLNAGVTDKLIAWIDIHTFLAAENKRLDFDGATDTITNVNNNDFDSFITLGFKVGMTIEVEDTVSNDGTYTITEVTDRTITVAEALIDELDEDASIFDDTPITALDFYYNLIENLSQESYLSLTDRGAIQRFTVSGLDATDVSATNMFIGSSSFGWVTNELFDAATGEVSTVNIAGLGIADHKQSFRIKHTFHVAPFATREQLTNFQNRFAPDYFQGINALKYIFKVDAKFVYGDPDVPHTGKSVDISGRSNWFDMNTDRTRPEYILNSIVYEIGVDVVDAPDLNQITHVTIELTSRTGQFQIHSKMILEHLYLPLDTADYINTSTTLRQNFFNDRKLQLISAAAGHGEYVGTDYQVLKNIDWLFVDANNATVEFDIDYSTYIKDFLKLKSSDNRNFALIVSTQDLSIAVTNIIDRVPVLCAVGSLDYNQDDSSLIQAVDTFRNYLYPDIDNDPTNDIKGYSGDPVYSQFPFRVLSTGSVVHTIQKAGFQIVAVHATKDDFILEEKIFNLAGERKLAGIPTINIEEERNFITYEDDPFNLVFIERDAAFDSGAYKGFMINYAFVLRYEFWNTILHTDSRVTNPGTQSGVGTNTIFSDIDVVSDQWSDLQTAGWSLKLRFVANILGTDGYVNEFQADSAITVKILGDQPGGYPAIAQETFYYDEDGNQIGHTDVTDTDGGSIVINGNTRIVAIFTGDFDPYPAGADSPYGYMFDDIEDEGGINNRSLASSELPSEDDSPFSPTDVDLTALTSSANGNVRINTYDDPLGVPGSIVEIRIEAWYDDSIKEWGVRRNGSVLIYPRLGFYNSVLRQFSDGELHLWSDSEQSLFP